MGLIFRKTLVLFLVGVPVGGVPAGGAPVGLVEGEPARAITAKGRVRMEGGVGIGENLGLPCQLQKPVVTHNWQAHFYAPCSGTGTGGQWQ